MQMRPTDGNEFVMVMGPGFKSGQRWFVVCRCRCETVFCSNLHDVEGGKIKTCGCGRIESIRIRSTSHGRTGTPEYHSWRGMIGRCENESDEAYDNYGGRGIRVCDRWRHSFDAFFADMGPRPEGDYSIDRFPDNNGNYEPGNCRWATRTEQNRNRRLCVIDDNGNLIRELAEAVGEVCPETALERVRNGWDIQDAIAKPSRLDTYQPVVETQAVETGRTRHLRLRLSCGCVVKRQWKYDRPIPSRIKCKTHPIREDVVYG